jgi:N-acetylglucosamine malate deacetylase 1
MDDLNMTLCTKFRRYRFKKTYDCINTRLFGDCTSEKSTRKRDFMKLDVLAIAAHPDDVELCCAGTLAALARDGRKVGVLDLTRGEMGTRGTPELRLREAQDAAGILGLAVRENAGLPDCGLENTPAHREAIIRIVRRYRPEVCFVNAPEDRHPDHRNAARLALDALFYSGIARLPVEDAPPEPWRPRHILHFMQHWPFPPTFVFDITETIDIKEKAIRAFASQFDVNDDDGPQTYVSSRRFFEALRGRAREYGLQIGVTFGEPFLYYGGPVPLNSLDVLFSTKPVR